jgi:hypothetical protein
MKLENKSSRDYIAFDVILKANSTQEVTNEKAIKILLKQKGVSEFADLKKQKDLEKENEKLQKQLKLAEARETATKLGIKFRPNISLEKLLAKIEEATTSNTGDEQVDAFLNGETDKTPEGTEEITEEEAEELENK